MPDETPNAANSQASEQAQVPEQTTPAVSAQTEQQTEAPLSREEMRKIAQEEAIRIAQSQVAKGENRINERIQEKFKALELSKKTLGLTDEQVAKAQTRIVAETYAEPEPQAATPNQPDTEEWHPLAQIAFPIFQEEGVSIEEGDPEFEKLKPYLEAPSLSATQQARFTRDLFAGIEAKKERIASDKEKAKVRAPSAGGTQTPGDAPAKDGRSYLKRAHKEG